MGAGGDQELGCPGLGGDVREEPWKMTAKRWDRRASWVKSRTKGVGFGKVLGTDSWGNVEEMFENYGNEAMKVGWNQMSRTLNLSWLKVAKDELIGFWSILGPFGWFCNSGEIR